MEAFKKEDSTAELARAVNERNILEETLETSQKLLVHEKKESSSLQKKVKELQKNLDLLSEGYKKLQGRFNRVQEEEKMKIQSIESLNDDFLSLTIENNLINNRVAKLKQENDELIKRWMDKVSQDAEILNNANAALEVSRKSLSPGD